MTAEMAETERSRADLRRAQILEAAHECFSREGFHAASMASIAAQADLSVGQIYRYFENKEAVIEAICVSKLEEWSDRVAEVRSRSGAFRRQRVQALARGPCPCPPNGPGAARTPLRCRH